MLSNIHTTLVKGATTLPSNAQQLRIIDGMAWFSQGSVDVVLKAGDEIELNGKQKAVISVVRKQRTVTYQLTGDDDLSKQ